MSAFLSGRNFGSNIQTSDIADDAITLAKLANGTANQNIQYNASGVPVDVALPASGKVAQIVSTLVEGAATTTTTIPYNDTIPQNNEGGEFMTLAITPTNASSILRIDVKLTASINSSGQNIGVALFQDSTANALAGTLQLILGHTELQESSINHTMTAGTTSETTFKVRAGPHSAGTCYFNSKGGSSFYGGVLNSSIIITEYLP